jgi:4-amino-4-deoxy-L-arabinose transferase-like glycosyltransferase
MATSTDDKGGTLAVDGAVEATVPLEAAVPTDRVGSRADAPADAPPPPTGLRRRLLEGLGLLALGAVATLLVMAFQGPLPRAPLWGLVTTSLMAVGVLRAGGLLFAPRTGPDLWTGSPLAPFEGEPAWLAPRVTVPAALLLTLVGAGVGGYDGLPVVLGLALALLLPAALRRPGLLVFVVGSALYLPLLGVFGLWDPWETHYGEVAREILARRDWISLWWAQDGPFWSKPVLLFWAEAWSMGALGVDPTPDANPAHPEWAIRLPHFVMTMAALIALYTVVARAFGKRAGLCVGLVLATAPHFFLLAHQAITDMPFVATMTVAMAMFGHAILEHPRRRVTTWRLGPFAVGPRQAVVVGLLFLVLPQVLYLVSRNVDFFPGFATGDPLEGPPTFGFAWHGDQVELGSAGNADVPGNPAHATNPPYASGLLAQPAAQALLWAVPFAFLLVGVLRERRAQALWMFGFYIFCALAFMAKGIPGFALPGLVALLWLVATRRWDHLLEDRFRVGYGVLIVVLGGVPWYLAMFVRHGPPFLRRLLIHDHINRLTVGVHMDETRPGSIGYFIEQLGYGLFPWIAFAPLALAGWMELSRDREGPRQRGRRELLVVFSLWLAAAFTLFSAMTTKFHHYIFPAVVPASVLLGLAFDRLLGPEPAIGRTRSWASLGLALVAPTALVVGVAAFWGDVRGILPEEAVGVEDWVFTQAAPGLGAAGLGVGIALLAGAWWLGGRPRPEDAAGSSWRPAALTTALFAAPVLLGLVGRDLSWVTDTRPQGYERLIHLFVYNYGRAWPEHLDYRPALTGFAIAATVLVVAAAWTTVRRVALTAFMGVALAFAVWCLDVYLVDLSPHWGQRELVGRYYEERAGPEEPLIAYQMNWKGENFYTGNRVHVFVDLDTAPLREWVDAHRGATVYAMTERSRLAGLRSALRAVEVEELTDDRFNNKFLLIRARLRD